jgi:hypothetical protein
MFEITRGCDDLRPTSPRGWFISKIRIGPDDSSVFGERRSNQEHFLDRTTLRHQRAITRR